MLPKDIRAEAAAKRKEARDARRIAQSENQRQAMIAAPAEKRAARNVARTREGIVYQKSFPIAGAFRSEERRGACERLIVDDVVQFEREPDNVHDANAILILGGEPSWLERLPCSLALALDDVGRPLRLPISRSSTL